MVNNINVSAYNGTPPSPCSCTKNCQCRVIRSAAPPLYAKELVVPLLDAVSLNLWTKKAAKDLEFKLRMDLPELAECIKSAVTNNLYQKSEWCQSKTDGPWAACDVYTYVHKYWCENAYKWLTLDCYFKFAVNKAGKMLLIASCHPSS